MCLCFFGVILCGNSFLWLQEVETKVAFCYAYSLWKMTLNLNCVSFMKASLMLTALLFHCSGCAVCAKCYKNLKQNTGSGSPLLSGETQNLRKDGSGLTLVQCIVSSQAKEAGQLFLFANTSFACVYSSCLFFLSRFPESSFCCWECGFAYWSALSEMYSSRVEFIN